MAAIIGSLRAVLSLDAAQFQTGLGKAQARLAGFNAKMQSISAKLAKIGGAMTVASAGLAVAIKSQLDGADELSKAAQKFGVPIESLSRLGYAADLSGVSFDELGLGLVRLSKKMAEAAGGNKKAAEGFANIGVAAVNADGSLRSTEDVLKDVAEVFSKMPDGAAKTALALDFFGKSGANLIPLLNGGKTALQQMAEEAESLGIVIDGKTGKAAENFNDNLSRIKAAVGGLVVQFAAELAPTLERITGWLVEATKGFRDLSPETRAFAAKLGLVALAAGPVILGMGLVIGSLGTIVTTMTTMKAIAVFSLANPFVLIAASAAAAAALIYLNWGSIKTWFFDIWTGIKQGAVDLWGKIGGLSSDAVIATLAAWEGIKAAFDGTLATVRLAFIQAWDAIIALGAEWIADFLSIGGQIVEGLQQGILERWDAMVAWLKAKSDELTQNFKNWFGIQSPSRVFRGFGQYITEGLALGLADNQPMVDGAMGGITDSITGPGRSLTEAMGSFKSAAQSAFVGFVTGAQSARSAAQQLFSSVANSLATNAFNGILGAIFPNANGNVFQGGRVQAFAKGGIVAGATAFAMQGGLGLMGEAGPEAIMPLTRGADGKLGVRAGGGALNLTVTVVMDESTGALSSFVQDQAGQVVARAAPAIVRKSVEATYAQNSETRLR